MSLRLSLTMISTSASKPRRSSISGVMKACFSIWRIILRSFSFMKESSFMLRLRTSTSGTSSIRGCSWRSQLGCPEPLLSRAPLSPSHTGCGKVPQRLRSPLESLRRCLAGRSERSCWKKIPDFRKPSHQQCRSRILLNVGFTE
jgi:hypothetical protein